jgi:hypothetical protein
MSHMEPLVVPPADSQAVAPGAAVALPSWTTDAADASQTAKMNLIMTMVIPVAERGR